MAVVLHGHPRLTADLDLAVDLAPDQAGAAIGALVEIGFEPRLSVDLFADEQVPFAELWARSVTMAVGAEPVRVASIDDLVALKRAAGRPQDLADIEALEGLRRDGDG